MKKPKWYNWTGNSLWDEYCAVAWVVIFIPSILFFLFIILGISFGWVEVVE